MLYDNFNSSAVKSVEILDNTVKIVYNSNINKEYTFSCEDVEEFQQSFSKLLIDVELNLSNASVGHFIHHQIKSNVLVESK